MRSPFLSNVTSWRSCNWYVCSLWCFTSAACYHLPSGIISQSFGVVWWSISTNIFRYSLQLQLLISLDRQMHIDDTRPTSIQRRRFRSARQELLNSWTDQMKRKCCCIWPPWINQDDGWSRFIDPGFEIHPLDWIFIVNLSLNDL